MKFVSGFIYFYKHYGANSHSALDGKCADWHRLHNFFTSYMQAGNQEIFRESACKKRRFGEK